MESLIFILVGGLFLLSLISGMLGLGVAFAAIPFLGFFFTDLVHQVQPLSLLLNGITALFAVAGFAGSGQIEWRKAGLLALVTTTIAPLGSLLVQGINQNAVWSCYLGAVLFLVWRLWHPSAATEGQEENFRLVLVLAVPIAILSGLLGVGPGFLLMPTLIICGFETKRAAGINALAVTPPSFSALLPHLATAKFDPTVAIPLIATGAAGSFIGARFSSRYLPSQRIKQIFGVLIAVMTTYRIYMLLR
jgi:uncharacterized membrane protein YfcA